MLDFYSPFDTAEGTVFFVSEALAVKHHELGLQQQPLYLPTPNKDASAPPHAPSKEADKAKKSSGMRRTTPFSVAQVVTLACFGQVTFLALNFTFSFHPVKQAVANTLYSPDTKYASVSDLSSSPAPRELDVILPSWITY